MILSKGYSNFVCRLFAGNCKDSDKAIKVD